MIVKLNYSCVDYQLLLKRLKLHVAFTYFQIILSIVSLQIFRFVFIKHGSYYYLYLYSSGFSYEFMVFSLLKHVDYFDTFY